MKKKLTKLTLAVSLLSGLITQAQTIEAFDTYTLSPNSYYQNNAGSDFGTGGITFQYGWNSIWNGWELQYTINITQCVTRRIWA